MAGDKSEIQGLRLSAPVEYFTPDELAVVRDLKEKVGMELSFLLDPLNGKDTYGASDSAKRQSDT